jgi:hypothetical protein
MANGNPVLQGTDNCFMTHRTAVLTSGSHEVGIADPNTSGKGTLGVYGIGQNSGVLGEGGSAGLTGTRLGDGVRGFGAGEARGVRSGRPQPGGVVGTGGGFGVFGADDGWQRGDQWFQPPLLLDHVWDEA